MTVLPVVRQKIQPAPRQLMHLSCQNPVFSKADEIKGDAQTDAFSKRVPATGKIREEIPDSERMEKKDRHQMKGRAASSLHDSRRVIGAYSAKAPRFIGVFAFFPHPPSTDLSVSSP